MAKKPQKKKFFNINIPLLKEDHEAYAYTLEELDGKSLKIDMTRKLRGKSLDMVFKIKVEGDKAVAYPKKLKLLPFFIKHMLRKSISYVEDSFHTQTKESDIIIKPFLITRKTVSRTIRKTLRNSARNWIMDYTKTKNDDELFEDILNGKMQKDLSIKLKKIYPLALCEIRILEIKNILNKPEKKNK